MAFDSSAQDRTPLLSSSAVDFNEDADDVVGGGAGLEANGSLIPRQNYSQGTQSSSNQQSSLRDLVVAVFVVTFDTKKGSHESSTTLAS